MKEETKHFKLSTDEYYSATRLTVATTKWKLVGVEAKAQQLYKTWKIAFLVIEAQLRK